MATVRTRFAPSPTGSLHVGGVRTALYCLLHSKHESGDYIVRIEDTDQKRSTDEAMQGILSDLRWLGLTADEDPEQGGPVGPYMQSERLPIYETYFKQLISTGHAYLAWETTDELQALRLEAQQKKQTFRYKRIAYSDEDLARFKAEARSPVLRLAQPKHEITISDVIIGEITFSADELEDVVIRKADGFPTYHFAVVIDDHLMNISQVLRGSEHVMNTPKHIGIMEALGWSRPNFGHLPIIMSMSGAKMSKRDKAKAARAGARLWKKAQGSPKDDWSGLATITGVSSELLLAFMKKKNNLVQVAEAIAAALNLELPMIDVSDFRDGGYLPEALLNYLALLGWSPGDNLEIMDLQQMIQLFTLDRVGKTPAKFDPQKLRWMNGEYIKAAPTARLIEAIRDYASCVQTPLSEATDAQLTQLIHMYRQRVQTLAELSQSARFFFEPPTSYDKKASQKHLIKGGGLDRLRTASVRLTEVKAWTTEALSEAIKALASTHEVGLGKFAQPLRIALTGSSVSPDIYDTLVFLGKEETLSRITRSLEGLSAQ